MAHFLEISDTLSLEELMEVKGGGVENPPHCTGGSIGAACTNGSVGASCESTSSATNCDASSIPVSCINGSVGTSIGPGHGS